jgi:hypothetical protein
LAKPDILEKKDVYAYIPQDFNLDIETTGHINGICPGDTKLIALEINLKSMFESIMCRKARADICTLNAENGAVSFSSSLESQRLDVVAGELGFTVGKRLGVGEYAKI